MTNDMMDEKIPEKSMAEKEVVYVETPAPKRQSRSVFGPIVLIAAGIIFLLANLNILPEPDWGAALRFWPLLLVFLGLNILAVQVRPPAGTFLSLVMSVVTVGFFSFMLFGGSDSPTVRSVIPETANETVTEHRFSFPGDGLSLADSPVDLADVTIELGNYPSDLYALEDSNQLIKGVIWSRSGVDLEGNIEEGVAEVNLAEEPINLSPFGVISWMTDGFEHRWDIGLNPNILTNLRVDSDNGTATLLLDELTLNGLTLNSGNGSVRAVLPDGDYAINIDSSNGAIRITLPELGRQQLELDGGNGGITLGLAESMEARIEFDEGNGRITVDNRFTLVQGDRDEGVYETDGYATASNRIRMTVSTGNGSLTVTTP